MKPLLLAVLLLSSQPLVHTDVQAGTQSEAVIALHALSLQFKGDACNFGPPTSCSEYTVDENPLNLNVTAYLIVGMADSSSGVASLSCDIAISNNVITGQWILCADTDIRLGGGLLPMEPGSKSVGIL